MRGLTMNVSVRERRAVLPQFGLDGSAKEGDAAVIDKFCSGRASSVTCSNFVRASAIMMRLQDESRCCCCRDHRLRSAQEG